MGTTQQALSSQSLNAYAVAAVRPRVHRNELNTVLSGVIETTVKVLDGKPVDQTRVITDAWFAWLLFNRQVHRYGFAAWSKQDRELANVLGRCTRVLHDAAGDDATKQYNVAEFEAMLASAYPALSPTMRTRLAVDVAHELATVTLIMAECELRIAQIEARKARRKPN